MQSLCLLFLLLGTSWGYEVETVTDAVLGGEGPHWNALTQLLYFVDLGNYTIHVYDPSTGVHNYTYLDGGFVSFIIPIAGTTNEFVVSTGLDIRRVVWDGEQDSIPTSEIIFTAPQDADGSKFNDAKVDRTGVLWAGTMGPMDLDNIDDGQRNGKLYQVSPSTGIRPFVENILLSNGLAWSPDGTVMYYTDSGDVTVDSFDFNATADNPLSNRQRIYNFTAEGIDGGTDGMTIDTDGNLWLACMDGKQVIAINPNNRTWLMSIPINAAKVTSLTWGGAELDELYVTTAKEGLTDEELAAYPDSGKVHRVTGLGARGFAADHYVRIASTTSGSNSLYLTMVPKVLFSFIISILIFRFG